ncbi:GNAT family N-acetyltransferase [Meiothermus taiwanensis]|uniref:Acetyltransferase (GNAT) domain protein n=2 Tax=Meiothermus taiwanensis TaxID=172827 RepID=A0A399E0D1_9DEIN|nr:GNAT family protein [Meiothermus taiwanensis]KIQ54011.1 GNAT family acetyltransferase [Meiothermus taiwanensis]KZK15134.1 GNAT family acetyltransferase [Meiothermus taiwanensis]RIH78104.1 Acetyltransferase (GNAT) domain protein [Meiothermus taiwanensis]
MWHDSPTLEGRYIRLEPLGLEHAPALLEHYDAEMVQYLSNAPREPSLEAMQNYIRSLLSAKDRVNWVIVDKASRRVAGRTGYVRVNPEHRSLETTTWIFTPYQGGNTNPESKYLLLCRAFEDLKAIRVQFRADARNTRSCRAIEKLGATFEGVLRKDQIYPNGTIRDTAVYSIIDEEWPQVKKGLEARLYGR